MKKIYKICENGENTGVAFTDKNEAEKFASLNEDYSVKVDAVFENIEDFKLNNYGNRLSSLKNKIKKLENEIQSFKDGKVPMYIDSANYTYVVYSKEQNFDTIINKHKLPETIEMMNVFDGVCRTVFPDKQFVEKHINDFVVACTKQVEEKVFRKEKILNMYKKEHSTEELKNIDFRPKYIVNCFDKTSPSLEITRDL